MIEIMNKLSIVAAAREDDDGTPDVQVIDADNDKSFQNIYDNRRQAKENTFSNSQALVLPERGPMN